MAVIQKNRYGLSEPCGSKNQVNDVISIDVARLDPQAAGRRDKLNGLLPRGGELKVNPIGACVGGAVSVLDDGEVRAKIAVKISNAIVRPGPVEAAAPFWIAAPFATLFAAEINSANNTSQKSGLRAGRQESLVLVSLSNSRKNAATARPRVALRSGTIPFRKSPEKECEGKPTAAL
ncbi:MAG: hypothetical protein WCD49_03070 [Candidatus Acidiferrales bacterium]